MPPLDSEARLAHLLWESACHLSIAFGIHPSLFIFFSVSFILYLNMQNISANASKMIAEELIPEKLKKLSIT
jgi:hypothetical protein